MMRQFNIILAGLAVFAASSFLTSVIIPESMAAEYGWLSQVISKLLLAVFSIALCLLLKIPVQREMALREHFQKKATRTYSFHAFLLGVLATAVILLLGIPGLALLKKLSFIQIILVVWICSSICEEIFARGFVQGMSVKFSNKIPSESNGKISAPVLNGAITFSLIHLSIFIYGGHGATTIVIMVFMFLLGLLAGIAREKSNLTSAILVHVAFNIGGVFGGMIINIISMIMTGHPFRQ